MSDVVELDGRRRLPLAQHVSAEDISERYLIEVEPDGTIVLTPAVTMSRVEANLLARPDVRERIEANRAAGHPSQHTGVPPRGSVD